MARAKGRTPREISPTNELTNPKHELYCQLFCSPSEYFGEGMEAYADAYDLDLLSLKEKSAAIQGSKRLLQNPTILRRIDYLLQNTLGFNDQHVDKQLAFLITQSADLKAKLGAIREYNVLRGRIRKKLDIEVSQKSMPELDAEYEELQQEIEAAMQLLQERADATADIPGLPQLTQEQKSAVQSGKADFIDAIIK